MTEIMTIASTGAMKGSKQARFSLIPREFLWALAEHYGGNTPEFGGKYPARNWEKGFDWGLSEDAFLRHYYLWKGGKRYDDGEGGTGRHHLICVIWHLVCLYIYDVRKVGKDSITLLEDTPK